jgi:hypothetical protein
MKAKDKNKVEVWDAWISLLPTYNLLITFLYQAYRSIKNAIVYADKEVGKEIQGDEILKVRILAQLQDTLFACDKSCLALIIYSGT